MLIENSILGTQFAREVLATVAVANQAIANIRVCLSNTLDLAALTAELQFTRCSRSMLALSGAVALAEFIAESPRLLRLDMRENDVKTGGLMALAHALKVNTSLTRIDLDPKPKKESVRIQEKYI